MEVETETSPARFWTSLHRAIPDLIILDFDMPGLDGAELCRVLRADPQWSATPVVFLTNRTDAASIHAAFAAGADDYLAKSSMTNELATRIDNRLRRRPAAGSERRVAASIEQLLHIGKRAQCRTCLVRARVVDIDSLSASLGSAAAQEITARVIMQLRARTAAGDVVGEWGTGEIILGLFDTTPADAAKMLETVSERVERESVPAQGGNVHIAIVAGIASSPENGEDFRSVVGAAEEALHRAASTNAGGAIALCNSEDMRVAGARVDVVLVEDDQVISDLLIHALRLQGYSARHIADGDMALQQLGGESPQVDARVILLDVDLPGRDGLTVLRELKRSGAVNRCKVVMLTARSTEREVLMSLELGAADHIAKPFSVPVLLQRIRGLVQNG